MRQHRSELSLFQLIDRKIFDELVAKHEMDKGIRSLSTWEMTCALITCMTLRLGTLREAEASLDIPRSTLSDALSSRFHGFFQDLCDQILLEIRGRTKNRKIKRGIRELLAIDSTECRVHGSLFSTPGWKSKYTIGHRASCKLHTVFNVDGQWIDDFKITGSRKHDSPVSLQFKIQSNKTYVFDRAYNDLEFWEKIIKKKSHFVTRLRGSINRNSLLLNAVFDSGQKHGVLLDTTYKPSYAQEFYHRKFFKNYRLRHIIYRDPETQKIFHFITSDWKLSAQEIADIYKRRWAVELLFRWLKGHLDIRYLAVKNSNAVKIQLTIAVLIQLLLQLRKITTRFNGTLWSLLRDIRTTFYRGSLHASASPYGCRWGPASTHASHSSSL